MQSIPIHTLLANALEEAFREIDSHPKDSIQDIVNESLIMEDWPPHEALV